MPRKRKEQNQQKPQKLQKTLDSMWNINKIQQHPNINNHENIQQNPNHIVNHTVDDQNQIMQINNERLEEQDKRGKRLLEKKTKKPSIEELKTIFSKESICLIGSFQPHLQIDVEHMLIVFGGKVSSVLRQDTTLVIKGVIRYEKNSSKKMQINCLIKLANMKEIQIISSKNVDQFLKGRTSYSLNKLIEISNRVDCAFEIRGSINQANEYVIQKVERNPEVQKLNQILDEGKIRLRKYLQESTSWALETLSSKMTKKGLNIQKRTNLCGQYPDQLMNHVQQNYLKQLELSSKQEFKHIVQISRDFVDADVIGNCNINFQDKKAEVIDEEIFLGVISPLQRFTQKLNGKLKNLNIQKNQKMIDYQKQRRLIKKIKNKISIKHSCSMFEVKNVMIPLICKTISSLLNKVPSQILAIRRLMNEYGLEVCDIKEFKEYFVGCQKKLRLL